MLAGERDQAANIFPHFTNLASARILTSCAHTYNMADHAAASHKAFPPDSPQVSRLDIAETPKDTETPTNPPRLDWEAEIDSGDSPNQSARKKWYSRSR